MGTRCNTRQDLRSALVNYVEGSTIFVPTRIGVDVGDLVRLDVGLTDGTVAFSATVETRAIQREAGGAHGKPGVLFVLKRLDEPNRLFYQDILRLRREGAAADRPAQLTPPPAPGLAGASAPPPPRSPAPAAAPNAAINPFTEISSNAIDMFVEATLGQEDTAVMAAPEPQPDPVVAPRAAPAAAPADEPRAFLGLPVPAAGSPQKTLLGVPQSAPPPRPVSPQENLGTANTMAAILPRPSRPMSVAPTLRPPPGEETPAPLLTPTPSPVSPPAEVMELESQELRTMIMPASARWRQLLELGRELLARQADRVRAWPRSARLAVPLVLALPVGLAVVWSLPVRSPPAHEPPPAAVSAPPARPGPAVPVQAAAVQAPAAPAAAVPAAPASPTRAAAAAAAPKLAVASPPPSSAPSPAAPTAPNTLAGDDPCTASVDSTPSAEVTISGKRLGTTPLRRAVVPCGQAALVIRHPRYRQVSQTLRLSPDQPAEVQVRLERPSAQLQLSSSPPGANFRVNGQSVGSARSFNVSRFETVRVEATLPRQKPWKKSFYVRSAVTKVHARLGR